VLAPVAEVVGAQRVAPLAVLAHAAPGDLRADRVRVLRAARRRRGRGRRRRRAGGDGLLVGLVEVSVVLEVRVFVAVRVAEAGVAHRHELEEEEHEDHAEADGGRPVVRRDGPRQTWVRQGVGRGREQLVPINVRLVFLSVQLTWMNAVATMTPLPKYLAKKNAYSMYLFFCVLRLTKMGKPAPDQRELHATRHRGN
jgi:hypothetical protein